MATDAAAATTAAAAPKPAVPTKTSSLWVGDLAPEVTETTLFEVFSSVAPVHNMRVCRNHQTRESMGYAYVNFANASDAEAAMNALNYTQIAGRTCRIMWSQRDPTTRRSNVGNVFVKNLGADIDTKQLFETFKMFGNISSCKVATDSKGASKGYGFVHFETEAAAKAAIEGVNGLEFNGRAIHVMPYLPRQQRSGPEWTNVYVKNLPKGFTSKDLSELFGAHGEIVSSMVSLDDNTGASRGFGFVCFKTHPAAVAAVEALNGKEMAGEPASQPPARKAKKEGEEDKKEGETEGEKKADSEPRKLRLFVGRAQKKSERERALKEAAEAAKRERHTKWAGCNLYVRNLDESIDDDKLRKEFSAYGTIISARLEKDAEGRSKLFGYVCLSSQEEASKAMQAMNHKMLCGKPLYVQLWQPKEARAAAMAQAQQNRANSSRNAGSAAAQAQAAMPAQMSAFMNSIQSNPQLLTMMFYGLMMQQAQAAQAAQQQAQQQGGAANPMAAYYQQMYSLIQRQQQQQMAAARGGAPNAAAANPMALFQQAASAVTAQQQAQAQQGARPGAAAAGVPASAASFLALFQQNAPGMAQAGQQGAQGPRGGAAPRGGRPGAAPGGVPRGAPGAPRTGAPAAAGAPGAGARPQGPAGARPQQGGRPAGQQQPGPMAYRSNARNVEADAAAAVAAAMAATVPAVAAAVPMAMASVPQAVAAGAPVVPADTSANFASQLANAEPAARRQLIGERLFALIRPHVPEKAGKITGMLLDGIDESELLHLLESPEELSSRISEALDVLAKASTEAPATA